MKKRLWDLQNEEIISQLEKLLMKEKNKTSSKNVDPMSLEEFNPTCYKNITIIT